MYLTNFSILDTSEKRNFSVAPGSVHSMMAGALASMTISSQKHFNGICAENYCVSALSRRCVPLCRVPISSRKLLLKSTSTPQSNFTAKKLQLNSSSKTRFSIIVKASTANAVNPESPDPPALPSFKWEGAKPIPFILSVAVGVIVRFLVPGQISFQDPNL